MKIQVFSDPGHAWAKVKIKLLEKLGIAETITHHSYMRGEWAYLEEDCDLTLFMKAAEKAGIKIEFVEHVCRERSSKIRSYTNYPRRTK